MSLVAASVRRLDAPTRPLLLAALTAAGIAAWTLVILATPFLQFVVFTPRAKTGFDVSVALLSLFVALVLLLFPDDRERARLDWIALGLLTLGTGALVFGYLLPVLQWNEGWGRAMYSSLVVRSAALGLIATGLVPPKPPRLTPRVGGPIVVAVVLLADAVALIADRLPRLGSIDDLRTAAERSSGVMHGLTGWHWGLTSVPLGLAIISVAGAIRHADELRDRGWLVVAMTLMVGTQLHTMLWPSAYSPVLTTASVLRLGFTLVLAIGAMVALRRVAVERTTLLVAEQEAATRLAEVMQLRSDFTAMIGHELASPIASLRAYAAALSTGSLDRGQQEKVGAALEGEAQLLAALVEDLRAVARAERVAFDLRLAEVELRPILLDAAAFGRSLPGEHPMADIPECDVRVVGDPERIAQVLRNLLANAGKHTPPGTPIELRATRLGERVWLEVADRGPGVCPDDAERIFEKFGRGRATAANMVAGLGLGLYVCRLIVEAHGGELAVEGTPGGGATFCFTLPLATGSNHPQGDLSRRGAALSDECRAGKGNPGVGDSSAERSYRAHST